MLKLTRVRLSHLLGALALMGGTVALSSTEASAQGGASIATAPTITPDQTVTGNTASDAVDQQVQLSNVCVNNAEFWRLTLAAGDAVQLSGREEAPASDFDVAALPPGVTDTELVAGGEIQGVQSASLDNGGLKFNAGQSGSWTVMVGSDCDSDRNGPYQLVATGTFASPTATSISLAPLAQVRSGHSLKVSGRVLAVRNGKGAGGVTVSVIYQPTVGLPKTVSARTSSAGVFQASLAVIFRGSLTVRAEATGAYGASSVSREISVAAAASCKLASLHVKSGAADHGKCVAPQVPVGTRALVEYESGPHWYKALQGTIHSPGTFTFVLRATGTGESSLRVLIEPNRLFTKTIIPLGTIDIGK
jgi:hypothetical protein